MACGTRSRASTGSVPPLVFVLPDAIGRIAYQNKAKVYGLLLKAAAETLTIVAGDHKYLGAEIGVISVLHSWGINLYHHPHAHCIVPGGGISPDGKRWIPGKRRFLSLQVLLRVFRQLILEGLDALYAAGELQFFARLTGLKNPKHSVLLSHPYEQPNGFLCQEDVSRPSTGIGVSRALHPSCCDDERSLTRSR